MGSYNFDDGHAGDDPLPSAIAHGGIYSSHTRTGTGLSGLVNPDLLPNYSDAHLDLFVEDTITTADAWMQPRAFGGAFDASCNFGLQIWLYSSIDIVGCGVSITRDPSLSFFEFFTSFTYGSVGFDASDYAGQWFHLTTRATGQVALISSSGATVASHTLPSVTKSSGMDVIAYQHNAGSGYIDDIAWSAIPPVVRKWPRDDGLGLSGASRYAPAPKNRRIVGRYQ